MVITARIFQSFLQCKTKAYLYWSGVVGDHSQFSTWERDHANIYTQQGSLHLQTQYSESECLSHASLPQDAEKLQYRLLSNCEVRAHGLQSCVPAVERKPAVGQKRRCSWVPVRFVPHEKITTQERLLLAFDALTVSAALGRKALYGKIIHGSKRTAVKIELTALMKTAQSVVDKIAALQASPGPPPLILNKHCPACEFQARCYQRAEEKDDLSLLSGLSEKERQKQHNKGIFSVTQLSYTFRARRKPKQNAAKPDLYSHALRALALRERKIHITGQPQLHLKPHPVYLDVEGLPDRDSYYLIGLRFRDGDAGVHHSFWANDVSEEKAIWTAALRTLAKIDTPQLIHYGSYETQFLKRMKERYGAGSETQAFLDQLIANAVNLLSVIYAQIYFPTYSNGLKDIARYLGYRWSEHDASGLLTLMWRAEWERVKDDNLKQKLITYNAQSLFKKFLNEKGQV